MRKLVVVPLAGVLAGLSVIAGCVVVIAVLVANQFELGPVVAVMALFVAVACLLAGAESWRRRHSSGMPTLKPDLEMTVATESAWAGMENLSVHIENRSSNDVAEGAVNWALRDGSSGSRSFDNLLGSEFESAEGSELDRELVVDLGAHIAELPGVDSVSLFFRRPADDITWVRTIEIVHSQDAADSEVTRHLVQSPDRRVLHRST